MDSSEVKLDVNSSASQSAPPAKLERQNSSFVESASGLVRQLSQGVMGRGLEEMYFCQICFENEVVDDRVSFALGCGHRFCRDCLAGYLRSKVLEGQVHPRCFFTPTAEGASPCSIEISGVEIAQLLTAEEVQKYQRYLQNLDDPNTRQCPRCDVSQVGNPRRPWMTCDQCGLGFCFAHATAHPEEVSCERYDRDHAEESKQSRDLVSSMAKKCPNKKCGIAIVKSSGCNAMKCSRCNTAFCWLCGKQIEGGEFPTHFMWWNIISGCPNKQLDGNTAGCSASFCTIFMLLVFGPPVLILSAVTFLLVFPCCFRKYSASTVFRNIITLYGNSIFNLLLVVIAGVLFVLALALYFGTGFFICHLFCCCRKKKKNPPTHESHQPLDRSQPKTPSPAATAPSYETFPSPTAPHNDSLV